MHILALLPKILQAICWGFTLAVTPSGGGLLPKLNKKEQDKLEKKMAAVAPNRLSTKEYIFLNQLPELHNYGVCRAIYTHQTNNDNPMFVLVGADGFGFAKHQPYHGSQTDELEAATGGKGIDALVAGKNYPCTIQGGRMVALTVE